MDKQQFIMHLRFEMATVRQTIRDLEGFKPNEDRLNFLLDRLNFLKEMIEKIESEPGD